MENMIKETSLMNTYAPLSPLFEKGEGVYLFDKEGNKYLDFTSGIGVNSLGYGNKKWVEATKNQLSNLQHISNIFLNENTIKLANKITEISGMSKVFFANSGTEANEGAIKLARKYSYDKYGEGRNKILTLKKSFHGRTMAALKATGQAKFHKYFFPFPEGFDYVEKNNIDNFKEKLTGDVCAIMMEAIQGEGGVYPLDAQFVKEVVEICNSKDILVIFDEVQCGIGRTGKLFGFNHFNVEPDIVTMAKGLGGGLPIGGVLCNEKLMDVFKPGDHGTTYGGNPVCAAGALVVLDTICNEKMLNEIDEKGEVAFGILKAGYKNIEDVRGKGLMIGIQTKIKSDIVQKKALEEGLVVLTAGENIVRLLPPLVMGIEELKVGLNKLVNIIENLGGLDE